MMFLRSLVKYHFPFFGKCTSREASKQREREREYDFKYIMVEKIRVAEIKSSDC